MLHRVQCGLLSETLRIWARRAFILLGALLLFVFGFFSGWIVREQVTPSRFESSDRNSGPISGIDSEAARLAAQRFLRAIARGNLVEACIEVSSPNTALNPCIDDLASRKDVKIARIDTNVRVDRVDIENDVATVTEGMTSPHAKITLVLRMSPVAERWRVSEINGDPIVLK